MTMDQTKNHPINSPNTKKNQANHASDNMSQPKNNHTTFAKFWRIFIGAAEAFASI